jgi:two-component system cell cycle sensor histidine kinase/response regulator CckA
MGLPAENDALTGPFAAVQHEVLELLASGAPLDPVLGRLAAGVEALLPEGAVSIQVVNGRYLRYVATPSLPPAYIDAVRGFPITPNLGSCLAAVASGRPVIVENVETHPNWKGYAHLATAHGLHACWSTPVVAPTGEVLGTFAVHYRRPMRPSESSFGIVSAATAMASIVMRHDKAQRALRVSEERFRQMAEAIDDVFWLQDAVSREVLYVSPAFERTTGLTASDLYENPHTVFSMVLPEDRDRLLRALSNVYEPVDVEFRIRRTDGDVRWLHSRRLPVFDAAGRLSRFAGISRDVTERKQLEQHLLQAQRVETLGSIASGIAHDLNNVLTPILMAASSLRDDVPDDMRESLVGAIESSATRGAALVQQILHFARGAENHPVPVDLARVVDEVIRLTRESMGRAITVDVRLPKHLPHVLCESTQLHQVILNLVVNARDAMPTGGLLTISARRDRNAARQNGPPAAPAGYIRLSVSDTGTGIPPELQDRIFDPFYTTKPPGHGSGLGLPTALTIVRRHGGHMSLESELGRGTTFHVYLPAATSKAAPGSDIDGARDEEGKPRARVLVVDDETAILEVMTVGLGATGYEVHTAASAGDALTVLESLDGAVDVVLLDVMMPGMDGVALAGVIRQRYPAIAVAAATGLPTEQLLQRLRDAGIRDCLTKPYDAAAVRRLIDERTGQR